MKRRLCAALLALSAAAMAANYTPRPGFEISDPGIYPESLTSTSNGDVFVGSARHEIYVMRTAAKAGRGARATVWAHTPAAGPPMVFGVFAHEPTKTLWACAAEYPESNPPAPRSTLFSFDLATGAAKAAYPLPTAHALCNDITVDSKGAVYATDSVNNEVLRLAPGAKQLEVWAASAGFGATDSALDGLTVLGERLFVNAINSGQLFVIDLGAAVPKPVELKLPRMLDTPDGMRAISKTAMLVSENGKVPRITRIDVQGGAVTLTELVTDLANGTNAVSPEGGVMWILEPKPFATDGELQRVRAVRVSLTAR